MIQRLELVAAARKYLGTPVQHQGRRLGQAVDCVGLLLCVAEDLGLRDIQGVPIRRSDYLSYGAQPTNGFVHQEARRRLVQRFECQDGPGMYARPAPYDLRLGDVLTLRVPKVACHVAIVAELDGQPSMIHAYAGPERVVENLIDWKWWRRIAGVFTFPGVED